VWLLLVGAVAVGGAAWIVLGPKSGSGLPTEAAGFRLVAYARADGIPNVRPPLGPSTITTANMPEAVEHRIGQYVRDDVQAEVRLTELDVTPVSGEALATGYGLVQHQGVEIDSFVVDGEQFVCADSQGSAACAWASGGMTALVVQTNAVDLSPDASVDPITGQLDPPSPPNPQIEPIRELAVALYEDVR